MNTTRLFEQPLLQGIGAGAPVHHDQFHAAGEPPAEHMQIEDAPGQLFLSGVCGAKRQEEER